MLNSLQANDIDTLKSRVIDEIMVTANNINISSVEQYIFSINPDGSFSDIDYTSTSQTNWQPVQHLIRMKNMCYVYLVADQSWYLNDTLLAKIELGMNYWYTVNPVSTNWWYNEIGKQKQLNIIGLLMMDYIGAGLLELIVNDLSDQPSMTGANLTDIATSVIYRGLIEASFDRVNNGLSAIIDEIVITTGEGLQTDFSFHQHGSLLYNRGYGYEFLKSTTYWCEKTVGTSFAYPQEKTDILSNMLLEGNRWMTRGKTMNYGTDGRGISRKINSDGNALACITYLNRMANVDTIRQAALLASANNISNGSRQDIIGNKHFWESDFTTHHREKFYSSVRMCSNRTKGTESINGENLKGYWLPFGLHFIFRRGNEYHNIFPLWDWGRLPGVTAPHIELNPGNGVTQNHTFVGGVSDSLFGVSAMKFTQQGTMAKKAWFFFNDEWVALGSEIVSNHSNEINTTINQAFLDTTLILVNGDSIPEGIYDYDSLNWVMNDSIAYIFLEKKPVTLKAVEQSGSWYSINNNQSSDTISDKIFTLYIRHGVNPLNDSYAYAVVPGISPAEAENYYQNIPIRIIQNDDRVQAVKHEQLGNTGIVFYQADSLNVDDTLKVCADASCIVMVRKLGIETYLVSIADPDENNEQITCTIYEGNAMNTTAFVMPAGVNKGQSVTMLIDNFTTSGIIEMKQTDDLSIYPNPAVNEITIQGIEQGEQVQYILYSLQGRILMEGILSGLERNKLKIDELSPGIYFIMLRTSGNTIIKKLIKRN